MIFSGKKQIIRKTENSNTLYVYIHFICTFKQLWVLLLLHLTLPIHFFHFHTFIQVYDFFSFDKIGTLLRTKKKQTGDSIKLKAHINLCQQLRTHTHTHKHLGTTLYSSKIDCIGYLNLFIYTNHFQAHEIFRDRRKMNGA